MAEDAEGEQYHADTRLAIETLLSVLTDQPCALRDEQVVACGGIVHVFRHLDSMR